MSCEPASQNAASKSICQPAGPARRRACSHFCVFRPIKHKQSSAETMHFWDFFGPSQMTSCWLLAHINAIKYNVIKVSSHSSRRLSKCSHKISYNTKSHFEGLVILYVTLSTFYGWMRRRGAWQNAGYLTSWECDQAGRPLVLEVWFEPLTVYKDR